MRYSWDKGLGQGQNLRTFGSALSYFKECMDELILKVNSQLKTFEDLIESTANHRIYIGASDRTQYAFSALPYILGRYCCYNGEIRPDIFTISRDANVPVNDPKTDIGIVVSGTSFTGPAINAMKGLTDTRVKTFFLTYTTLEKAREQQEAAMEEQNEIKESVWDHFIKQPHYEERVIYLPMREESWKREQKRASLAPMGTKFELSAAATAMGIGNGLRTYHSIDEDIKPNETPLVTFLNTLVNFRNYLDVDLTQKCYESRLEIADFIQDLFIINHKKIVGFGGSENNALSFANRLTHCGHLGKGEKYGKENKSVHILKSAYSGFITRNNMVIGISKSGDNPYTSFILKEAMKQNPEKIYLITCHANPTITAFNQKIVLPPIISTNEEESQNTELGYLNTYAFLDSCIAQLADNLDLDEEDMKSLHRFI